VTADTESARLVAFAAVAWAAAAPEGVAAGEGATLLQLLLRVLSVLRGRVWWWLLLLLLRVQW